MLGSEAACLQSREETWPRCWGGGVLQNKAPFLGAGLWAAGVDSG